MTDPITPGVTPGPTMPPDHCPQGHPQEVTFSRSFGWTAHCPTCDRETWGGMRG